MLVPMAAKLAALGIVTKDMAAAARFYRELGVDVAEPGVGEDHHEATLPNGLRVMWDTAELMRKLHPDWREPQGHPIVLAFECESPAEVDQTYARVTGAGFEGEVEPYDAFWGQRYATLLDPDGNAVDLFAALDAA
jgi:catechol 2,3-dioxygenase-like lactoylglutathione lyase family enzyme